MPCVLLDWLATLVFIYDLFRDLTIRVGECIAAYSVGLGAYCDPRETGVASESTVCAAGLYVCP